MFNQQSKRGSSKHPWLPRQYVDPYQAAIHGSPGTPDHQEIDEPPPPFMPFMFQPPQSLEQLEWDTLFQELRSFNARYGHCNVSLPYTSASPQLHTWIDVQRILAVEMEVDPTQITQEKMNRLVKLHELDFPWKPPEQTWEERFQQLADFKRNQGHTHVPLKHPLAHWVRI